MWQVYLYQHIHQRCPKQKPGDFITAIESTYYPETHQDFIIDPVREELTSGLSHTKTVHYYKLSSDLTNNKTILLVDTPGLGAAEGIQQDDSFIENIIDSVRNHPTINAILVLERSSTNRITAYVDYCLYWISEVIPNGFERKAILGITFYSGKSDFNVNWFAFNVELTVNLNNASFSYSQEEFLSKLKKLKKHIKNWGKSVKKIKSIIKKVFQMTAQETSIYTELFKMP